MTDAAERLAGRLTRLGASAEVERLLDAALAAEYWRGVEAGRDGVTVDEAKVRRATVERIRAAVHPEMLHEPIGNQKPDGHFDTLDAILDAERDR